MTESSVNKTENGEVCHRAKNSVKPGRNGFVKNHHQYHQQQLKYGYPEEKVRPEFTIGWMMMGLLFWTRQTSDDLTI